MDNPEKKFDAHSHISRVIDSCRVCGFKNLIPILSLGDLFVSDFLGTDEAEARRAPLELVLCNEKDGGCGLLQLKHTVSPKVMYRNYWYRSGMNKTMTDELTDIAGKIESIASLGSGDSVIDIGSNDGTLLRALRVPDLHRIGFEPARNIAEKYGREGITNVITDFFSYPAWQKEYGEKKAKAITAIAMFYDLDDPNTFVADLVKCLDKDGCLIIQMLYLPSLLERNAFDGICHEHLEFYSLSSFENLLRRHDLEVFDAEFRPINEGSYRFYIRHKDGGKNLKIDPKAAERVEKLRKEEKELGLHDKKVYEEFVKRVNDIKEKTRDFVKSEVAKGKKIHAYGASTKGNTLLQFFGLEHPDILAAADRNPDKWGLRTVGTSIPIVSEDASRAEADYFLILPWHFLKEFRERESEFLKKGGKFIVPLPEFKIVSDEE